MNATTGQRLDICFPEPPPSQPVRICHGPVPLLPSEPTVGQASPRPAAVSAKAVRNPRGQGNPCEHRSPP